MRSGVEWSVDDERVATIDPLSGVLTPLPMNGQAEVTVFAKVRMAGFELPIASKRLLLDGVVIGNGDDAQTNVGGRSACGALGMTSVLFLFAGRFLLALAAPLRPRSADARVEGRHRRRFGRSYGATDCRCNTEKSLRSTSPSSSKSAQTHF